jgi:hypothetical protein
MKDEMGNSKYTNYLKASLMFCPIILPSNLGNFESLSVCINSLIGFRLFNEVGTTKLYNID